MNRTLFSGMESGMIVFASGNAGKLRELNALLEPLGHTVKPQGEFDVDDVEETASTYVENALLKARNATLITGFPAIADDSGLEVDALHGAPGLYSARYANMHHRGEGDVANYELLLEQLSHVRQDSERAARFRSVVVYIRHAKDASPIIAEGTWEGHILHAPKGSGGFGYDPVFCNHDTGTAASLLDAQTKNRISHRGKAIAILLDRLAKLRGPGVA